MKQQGHLRISMKWLAVTAIMLTSAGSFAGDTGTVTSGRGSVNEVYGRASATIPGTSAVRSISGKTNVSAVFGRGSDVKPLGSGTPVATGSMGVIDVLGRSSGSSGFASAKSSGNSQAAALHR